MCKIKIQKNILFNHIHIFFIIAGLGPPDDPAERVLLQYRYLTFLIAHVHINQFIFFTDQHTTTVLFSLGHKITKGSQTYRS